MYIGETLGLTVPQLMAMGFGEFTLWRAYFIVKEELVELARRRAG